MLEFIKESTMPFIVADGAAVVYNNKVHVFYNEDHYSWNGNEWQKESTLPITFVRGNVVVYNNKIHILGSNNNSEYYYSHYSWSGNKWQKELDLPDNIAPNLAVVYNNKIHLLGGDLGFANTHYTWGDGENEWSYEELESQGYYSGGAIVYNDLIYLFGGQGHYDKYITYDGNSWSEQKDIGFNYNASNVIVYNNKINFIKAYYNDDCCIEWTDASDFNVYCQGNNMWALSGPCVVYNDKINIFGGNISVANDHYILSNLYNKVIFNGEKIIDLSNDTVDSNKILDGYIAHDNTGRSITGTYPVMPVRYNSSKNIIFCNNKIEFLNEGQDDDSNRKTIAQINDGFIWMHVCKYGTFSGENIGDVIISRNDNEDTEYKIVISHLDQNYIDSFELLSVNYLNRTQFLIQYRYQTGENTYSPTYIRLISSATVDDVSSRIIVSNEVEISGTTTLTNKCDGYIVRTDDASTFVIIQTNITISTGELELSYAKINVDIGSMNINIPQENTWTILAESNTNNYISPWFYSCSRHCPVIFIDGNTNTQKALCVYGYNTTDIICNAFSTYEPMKGAHVIGKNNNGYYMLVDSTGKTFYYLYIEDNQLYKGKQFSNNNFMIVNTIPINFNRCCVVVYNNNVHILGDYYDNLNQGLSHYVFDGNSFTKLENLPYQIRGGCAVVYNNKIHIMGSNSDYTKYRAHYSWDGESWTEESELPYDVNQSCVVVYNNKIHILGSYQYNDRLCHYSWNGTEWTQEIDCPFYAYQSSAVVFDNKIHLLGSYNYGDYRKHYSYNGSEWAEELELPFDYYQSCAVVYNNKIYLLGSYSYNNYYTVYSYDGNSYNAEPNSPYQFYNNGAVVYNNTIYVFGSGSYDSNNKYVYLNNNNWSYDKEGVFFLEGNIFVNKNGQAYQEFETEYDYYPDFRNINLDNSNLNVIYDTTFLHDKIIGPSSDIFQNIYISDYSTGE